MVFNCNMITIVIFNLFQTISRSFTDLINGTSQYNLCNDNLVKGKYEVEYWLANETSLVIARVISNSIFIIMAFTNANIIIIIFAIFLVLLAYHSIKLQNIIAKED